MPLVKQERLTLDLFFIQREEYNMLLIVWTSLFAYNRKITQSMSRKGNYWDNAVGESFFKTIKHEWLYGFKFVSYLKLHESIKDYIDRYNTKRLHSSLGYLTPLEMELKLKGVTKKVA
jgi:putative transposase